MLADTVCPICGDKAKMLLANKAGDLAFQCVMHREFEVTPAAMEKAKHLRGLRTTRVGRKPCIGPRRALASYAPVSMLMIFRVLPGDKDDPRTARSRARP
jgi:hypothetical protein